MVNVKIMNITPAIANQFLGMNIGNRSISKSLVESYAADMAAGRWHTNGEPITISGGRLISGQHRMLAVLKSGVTLNDVVVVYTDDADMVDTGRTRSVKDLSGIDPFISAAVSIVLEMTMKKKPSKAFIIQKYNDWKEDCDYVESIINNRKVGLRKAALSGAVLAARMNGYPEDLLEQFCKVLISGETKSEKDRTIIMLRDLALTYTKGGSSERKIMYLKTQAVLKAYSEGRTISKIHKLSEPYYKVTLDEDKK